MKPAAVLFDMDGTLVAFTFDAAGTKGAIVRTLDRMGFDVSGLGEAVPTQSLIDAARAQIDAGIVRADFGQVLSRVYEILDESEVGTAATAVAFTGVQETLDLLRSNAVRLGAVTNSGRSAATQVLTREGLDKCFEFVLCREDVPALKPRPDGVALAVELLGVTSDEVVYVGDSMYDAIAAKAAGVKMVGVLSGRYTEAQLRATGSDYVIRSIADLPSLFGV